MKRKGFWSIVAASLMLAAAALVTGCADAGDGGGTYSENNGYNGGSGSTGGVRDVKITAMTSDLKIFGGGSSSRALVPGSRAQYPVTTSADYDFYLCYSNATATQVQKVNFTTVDDMSGTYKIKLQTDVYNMTLYAVPNTTTATIVPSIPAPTGGATASTEADILAVAALRSYAVVDMRYQKEASFLLTPTGLSGQGDYEITIVPDTGFTVPDSSQYTITAALYPFEGDVNTAKSPIKKLKEASGDFDTTVGSDGVAGNVLKGKIDCGIYTVKVLFTPVSSGDPIPCTTTITVLTNLTTTHTFPVSIDKKSGTPPNAPQQFIAGYRAPAGSKSGVYTVEFAWVDTSDNEDGFEIDLMRVDDPTDAKKPSKFPEMPKDNTTWKTLKGDYVKTAAKTFDAAHYATAKTKLDGVMAWRDKGPEAVELITLNCENLPSFMASMASSSTGGSLGPDSNHLKIELPLGHRYVARIRAVNGSGGASPYVYLKLPAITANNATPLTLTTPSTAAGALTAYDDDKGAVTYTCDPKAAAKTVFANFTANTPFAANVETLNLYRIYYNVLGGKFKDTATKQGPNPEPVLLSFHSERTISGGASTSNVNLLTPDSKIADNDAGVARVDGAVNNAEMLGAALASGSAGIRLELMSESDTYWLCWLYGDATADPTVAANHYPQIIGGTSRNNELYTGYDNLDLVAGYEAGNGDDILSGEIALNLINRYAMEPSYIKMNLYTQSGAASGYTAKSDPTATSQPDDFKDNAKLSDLTTMSHSIEIKRGSAANEVDSMGFTVEVPAASGGAGSSGTGSGAGGTNPGGTTGGTSGSTTTTAASSFAYDKIRVEVYSSAGAFYVAKESTNTGSAKTVKFRLPSAAGNYKVHIYGYKGSYILETEKQLRITVK